MSHARHVTEAPARPSRAVGRRWALPAVIVSAVLALASVVVADGQTPQAAPAKPGTALRALYVTGGGFHDFVAQEKIVPPGVSQRAKDVKIDWTIDHSA